MWATCFGAILGGWSVATASELGPALPASAALEILEFQVPVEQQAEFLNRDERVWGAALKQQPGFLYRQVWFQPDAPDRVKIAIYWASREQWKAFPSDLQADLDRQMQPFDKALVGVEEYALRSPAFESESASD